MFTDVWSRLEIELSELRDLFRMRLETKEEGVGERVSPGNPKKGKKAEWRDTAPRWVDEEHGQSVRPWLMIPYVDALDQEDLQLRLEAGRNLLQSVEQRVCAKEMSPELLQEWGLLNRIAGGLQIAYHARPDTGRLRQGSENLDAHKWWFAHYFLRIYRHRHTSDALDTMEHFINCLVAEPPAGCDPAWFERFLSEKESEVWEGARSLTGAFRDGLSAKDMKRLTKQQAPKQIPSLELRFPPP